MTSKHPFGCCHGSRARKAIWMDLCIVSGGDRLRLRTPVNHKIYASLHDLDYRLETGPFEGLHNPYFFKLRAVLSVLDRYDWVVWLDDDAFVTDFTRDTFRTLAAAAETDDRHLVVADGRVRPDGPWTVINTGVFLARRSPAARRLLERALGADLREVRAWWNPAIHGYFTDGDQDAVLWAMQDGGMQDGGMQDGVRIVGHEVMNSRTHHYGDDPHDRFVCHFPGVPDKEHAVRRFGARFGRDDTLTPPELLERFGVRTPARPSLASHASRRVRRTVADLARSPRAATRSGGVT